jgi:hypothetical protein
MSWQLQVDGGITVLMLADEIGIQNASEFHQAVLPLGGVGGAVRLDVRAVKSVHTSILQILYALSQAVTDFDLIEASGEFEAIEARVGLFLTRSQKTKTIAKRCEETVEL